MNLSDEMFNHFLCDFEIGDYTVTQRPDGLDVTGSAAEHQLGFFPHGKHLLSAFDVSNRHHRRFVEHDASSLHVDKGICGAEVDCHVGGQ